jgi:hypothetical protein
MPITPPNSGPRPKQIQKLKNDETVPADGSLLGVNASGKTDWLDVKIQDLVIPSTSGGRITNGNGTVSGDPIDGHQVSNGDGYVMFVPYVSDLIALYDGVKWNYHRITGTIAYRGSVTATENAGVMVGGDIADIFIYDNGGQLAIAANKWATFGAGTSTRAANYGIVRQNGVWVSEDDNQKRYVGTIRWGSTIFGGIPDILMTQSHMNIWNVQNQILTRMSIPGGPAGTGPIKTVESINQGNQTQNFTSFQHLSHQNDPDGIPTNEGDFPLEIVVGLPTAIKCSWDIRFNQFVSDGNQVTQSLPNMNWRIALSVELNNATANAMGTPAIERYGTPTTTSITLDAMFRASRVDTVVPGQNQYQPIWVAYKFVTPFNPPGGNNNASSSSYFSLEWMR